MKKIENILLLLTPKANIGYLTNNLTIRQALEKMRYHGYSCIPVLDNEGKYLGTVSEGDMLWYLYENNEIELTQLENRNLIEIINTKRIKAQKVSVGFEELIPIILNQNFVAIVDDFNTFMGIITRKSIIDKLKD